ncbi:MAG TPA: hypothetical protein VKB25_03735 [Conexibacter sp.]|nr:hypothetical protein [Conexibacter sp.]
MTDAVDPDEKPPTGFPEPPGADPGDRSRDPAPHHALNHPVGTPDETEWPDPYDQREDPRDPPDPDGAPFGEQPHPQTGSQSTSEPHPSKDPEAEYWEGPKRDKLDE